MVEDGDFILIEYTARVKGTDVVVDTTSEEIAKKHRLYDKDQVYGPMLVILGRGWVIKGLEEALREMQPGEEKEIEIPPEKAFGEHDPSLVKRYSIREFRRRGHVPSIGDIVEINGSRGIVRAVTGGRVVVDFNHPLAGKTLVYRVKIVKKLEDFNEKLEALAARYFSAPLGTVKTEYKEDERTVIVYIPSRLMTKKDIQYSKIAYASIVYELFKDKVDRVIFIEAIEFPKPKEKTGEEKPGEEEKGEAAAEETGVEKAEQPEAATEGS